MRYVPLGFLLALSTLASRAGAQSNPNPTSTQVAAVTLPAPLDRVLRDYEQAYARRDAAALSSLFADDGFVLQSGRTPVRGTKAIQSAYAGQGGPLRLRAYAFATADSVGYIIGGYGYGDTPGDQGKFTLTLRRRGGRWLIYSDMDNTSRSARPGGN